VYQDLENIIARLPQDLSIQGMNKEKKWNIFISTRKIQDSKKMTLQQFAIALRAENFLECQNRTTKKYIVSLAMLEKLQEKVYSLRGL
jgi:hypothetical protein